MVITCYLASCPVSPSPHSEEDLGVFLVSIHDALEHQDSAIHYLLHPWEEGSCLCHVTLSRVVREFAFQLTANHKNPRCLSVECKNPCWDWSTGLRALGTSSPVPFCAILCTLGTEDSLEFFFRQFCWCWGTKFCFVSAPLFSMSLGGFDGQVGSPLLAALWLYTICLFSWVPVRVMWCLKIQVRIFSHSSPCLDSSSLRRTIQVCQERSLPLLFQDLLECLLERRWSIKFDLSLPKTTLCFVESDVHLIKSW